MMIGSCNGDPAILSGVAFDLTEFCDRTDMVISKLNKELLRSNKELEDFAYIASHDLQEPLRMVSSFTQLLAMQYGEKLDDRAREYIEYAVNGARRMYDLLNDLLSYSRVNTKGEAFSRTDLQEILEIVMQNLSLTISESQALISAGRLPVVSADRNQMVQLLQNLVSNSIKFSAGKPRIFVSAETGIGCHVISVRDEGIGIDPVYFDRIFKIFKRLHHKDEYEGTGVGLAICKRIVERHGGTITVKSEPGKGATFSFTIPC
jgi:light-regulated signal transduction histidine kinase (bacteriophytochrome)